MTVSTATSFNSYAGNGSTTSFAYAFKIFQDSNLVVTLVNDTTGVETTQTLTTDYTVTGAGSDSGGNVVFGTAPASGNTVVIRRVLPVTQETNYVPNDPFPAEAHEDALDKLTMLVQQEVASSELAVQFPTGDVGSGINNILPSVTGRADKLLKFDTEGAVQVIATSDLASAIIGANYAVDTFTGTGSTTVYTLSAAPGSKANTAIYIDGVYQAKANYSVSGSTLTFTTAPPLNSAIEIVIGDAIPAGAATTASAVSYTQGGTGAVTTNVQAKLRETVSVKDFGAVGDGVTDDAASIQKALDYIRDNATGGSLYFPTGIYKCNSVLALVQSSSNNNKNWIIDGGGATLDFSSSGLTSGSLLNIGCTGTNFDFRERAITVVKNLKIIGPETGNAYVVSGPADHTPDGSTIGLDLGSLLNVTLQDVYVRRCFTGIRTQRVFPLNAFHVVAAACTTGIKIEEGSTYGTWINCSAQASRHGIVIAPTVTDGGISNQTFYSQRVENCLRGVTVDQGVSSSGTSRQVRGIAFYSPYMEAMAYDYFRLGKTWDVSVTSADSADRNAAYLANVTIQGGRAEDPTTSGFIIRSSANDFVNGCVLDIPAGNFSKITGSFALSKIFLQSRVDGGSEIGDIKFTNGTEIIANGGINLNTNASYIDFQGFNTAGSGTRLKTKLDYYEEASFTPNLWDNSSNSSEGQTYTTQLGYYTRIGNMVSFNIRLIATSLGTLTTGETARISLPLTSSATKERASVAISEVGGMSITSGQSVHGVISAGTDYISLQLTDGASGYSGLLLSEFTATGQIAISGTYFV